MNNLLLYGWNELLFQQKQESIFKDCLHGRVSLTHKTCYQIVSEEGLFTCDLSGNILHSRDSSEYPCTGDWVIFQAIDNEKDETPEFRGVEWDFKKLEKIKKGHSSAEPFTVSLTELMNVKIKE